jgi:hypothetical protein
MQRERDGVNGPVEMEKQPSAAPAGPPKKYSHGCELACPCFDARHSSVDK